MLATGAGCALALAVAAAPALPSDTHAAVRVSLEVRGYLAVKDDGEAHASGRVIALRDPDSGVATYVVLDD